MTESSEAAMTERRTARLSRLLAASDGPARAVAWPAERVLAATTRRLRSSVILWRAAAAAAVLVAGVALVPPVRAWITGAARDAWERIAGRPEPVVPMTPAVAPEPAGNRISFVPAPELFVVEIFSRQAEGTLIIETVGGTSATAEVNGRAGDAELVVMPTGLRIINAAEAAATYTVRVPASLSGIAVRIRRERVRSFTPSAAGERFVVELGRTSPSGSLQD